MLRTSIANSEFATRFQRWVLDQGLSGTHTVNEVLFMANEDFAPALDLRPPPNRSFLSELKKLDGVKTTKNKRVYDREGRVVCKTTYYEIRQPNMRMGDGAVVPLRQAS